MDSYQAVYDAVRSKISGCDAGSIMREAVASAFDISWPVEYVKQTMFVAIHEYQRPSVMYRPSLSIDGDQWCALYGEDLQSGVAGFGSSPSKAMDAFDVAWRAELEAKRSEKAELIATQSTPETP